MMVNYVYYNCYKVEDLPLLCSGFGAFVDKCKIPYVNTLPEKLANPCEQDHCQPAFSFKHILKITDNMEEFEREVSKQSISTNVDMPESGFDGVMQVAVCEVTVKSNNNSNNNYYCCCCYI